jgi:TPP-dependent pyruvate/acetoin dehydrogenase alpha subunit
VQVLGMKYRTDEELERWKQRDPIDLLEGRLPALGVLSGDEIQAVHADVEAQVEAAIQFAEDSPLPDPDTLLDDVYTLAKPAVTGGAA